MSKLLEALQGMQDARAEYRAALSTKDHGAINDAVEMLAVCADAVNAADAEMPMIMLESWITENVAALRYSKTLDWLTSSAQLDRTALHIGRGVFVVRCAMCGQLFGTYGAQPYYSTAGRHEYDSHPGAQVPGINVGLLP